MRIPARLILACIVLFIAGCQPVSPAAPSQATTLVLASHDSFNASQAVINAFETAHNVKLKVLTLGDAGEALNKVILSKDVPLADAFFGVDNTFLSRALGADLFVPYDSPMLAQIPEDLQLDPQHRLLPVDYGFININADKAWFAKHDIPLPQRLEDLVKPEYANLLVVQNPATSSPGLAFLLTTVAHFGQDGYLKYWQALRANGVLITNGWTEAYFQQFTVGSGGKGDRPLCVSYTTSPPADVVDATDGRTEPASVNISPPDGTFRQVEFVGILKNAAHPDLARAWVDYMLGIKFQEDVPLQMYVYPANRNAKLPDVFVKFGQTPSNPVKISSDEIQANRDAWIEAWTNVMLH